MISITCPLCRQNYVIFNKLCNRCEKIRHLSSIYGMDKLIEILEKILIIRKFNPSIQEPPIESICDEN
jgi:hypothetical protein